MKVLIEQQSFTESSADLLVLACFSDTYQTDTNFQALDASFGQQLTSAVADNHWTGQVNEVFVTPTLGQLPAKRIALIGLGTSQEATSETFRNAAAAAVKRAKNLKATSVMFVLPNDESVRGFSATNLGQSVAEGALLANYEFDGYARDKKETTPLESLSLYTGSERNSDFEAGISAAEALASGVNLARDLVNTPPNMMTPTVMAQTAADIAQRYGMTLEVLDRREMEALGMGSFLAVAQGSAEPPKMIVLRYQGRDTWGDVIGFVGKGITFDSGGLSIKTAAGMEDMKTDMGGGASVLGAMEAIGRLKPQVNVVGVIAATENMPSGTAFRPGDVIKAMTGKTIEVLNTDAEGRLALADAVAYAKHHGASQLIDLATLTGAALVALGTTTTAAMTNDEMFLGQFMEAAKGAGEKVWQLPTFDEYRELIKSDIADVKNIGGRFAGSITAGLFIEAFVEGTPWIHLDIAGTAYSEKATPIGPKGATGVMVRTLVGYAQSQAE